jgi:hypothetical protein
MNNHQYVPKLLRCSKPSRWRQPPRVTRNPQPQWSPSATRCNHSNKCTWNYSQSHYDDESMMEMSGRCFLRLTRMSSMSKCQESEPQVDQTLFIDVPKRIEPLEPRWGVLRSDRTRWSGWPDAPNPASGRGSHATCQRFECHSLIVNGHKWSAPSQTDDRTRSSNRPDAATLESGQQQ